MRRETPIDNETSGDGNGRDVTGMIAINGTKAIDDLAVC